MPPQTSSVTRLLALLLAIGVSPATAQLAPRSGSLSPSQSKKFQLAAAEKIDKLVGADFRRKRLSPLPKSTDADFLRRTYLSAIGRIPTYAEAIAFLDDADPDKRTKLVDKLVASDGFSMQMFNWWADLLRVTDGFQSAAGSPYTRWIKNSIAENIPYDQMVHQLVSATGSGWSNGAVGYYVRDSGMLKDNMANTTRIFLGTRIECAQCHNHPFDSWKQMDFYEMAAFTNGIKSAKAHLSADLERRAEEIEDEDRELSDVAGLVRSATYEFSIADSGKGTINLPHDYQYRDAAPGDLVGGNTLFGKKVRVSTRSKRKNYGEARQKFADWLTSEENPRFTTVIANRLWKKVMGTGQFEPLDNFSAASAPSNPALMSYLEELMRDLDYDIRAFQRVLYYTYTYGLATNPVQHPARSPYHSNGRQMKRLSAEQIWDSLLTLKVGDPDGRKGNGYGSSAIVFRGRPVLVGKKSMADLSNEVMALDSGDAVWDYVKKLRDEIKSGGGGGGGKKMEMMMTATNQSSKYGQDMRASELSSPMPNGHFLRQFGQSNRIVIDAASTDSDVTQVLSILNGHVERNLGANGGAEVYKILADAKSDAEKIDRLFLAVLSRRPTDAEKELFLAEFKMDPGGAASNTVSALLSTAEFMFVR